MNVQSERIDFNLNIALCDYAKAGDAKMQKAFEEFKQDNRSQYRGEPSEIQKKTGMKAITYDKLSEFLRICGLRVDEMFAQVGVPVEWPNDDFRRMAEACDRLPKELVNQVAAAARELSSDWHKTKEVEDLTPTHRALYVLRWTMEVKDRTQDEIPSLRRAWDDAKWFTTIDTKALPEISVYLQVSLRWLMCLDDDILVYAKKPETEAVLDELSFMSPEAREELVKAVEAIVRGENYDT